MDGVVIAYRAGAKLCDMDSVQYHPTGAAYPEQIVGFLITEKVRSLGAQPLNCEGINFVHQMEPRDVETSAYIRECYERNKGIITETGMRCIWLDTPMIDIIHGTGTIEKNLSAMFRLYKRFGINIAQEPILVFPTLHYQNGGVEINTNAETSVKYLLACGEVSGGIHGKNRLMGNSLLDMSVFGHIAGIHAAELCKKIKHVGNLTLEHVKKYVKELENYNPKITRKSPMLLPDYRNERVLSRCIDVL